jgi:hypothetical protein
LEVLLREQLGIWDVLQWDLLVGCNLSLVTFTFLTAFPSFLVVWTKSNPTPWNTIKPEENTKLLTVQQKFDKKYVDIFALLKPALNCLPPLSQLAGPATSCRGRNTYFFPTPFSFTSLVAVLLLQSNIKNFDLRKNRTGLHYFPRDRTTRHF